MNIVIPKNKKKYFTLKNNQDTQSTWSLQHNKQFPLFLLQKQLSSQLQQNQSQLKSYLKLFKKLL